MATMNGLPYYKRFPRDFIEGTIGMPLELKGAYSIVLDLIYMHSGALPDDAGYISGVIGCSPRQWGFHRKRLVDLGKLVVRGAFIGSSRADRELFETRSYQEQQAFNGSRPKKNKHIAEATAKPNANHTDTDTERGEAKASLVRVGGFAEFWDAYPHRGARRNRKGAEAKYAAAVRRGVPEQTIIEAARRAHDDRRVRDGYARDPTTWLSQEGWADEVDTTVTPFPQRKPNEPGLDDYLDAFKARLAVQRLE
jgi:uncharacterized protein YdaU (DUF1376 family)